MTYKTAYLWGPVSSFSGQLAALLVQKGWHVHMATKSAFHVALSPLDLRSSAEHCLERALGGREKYKIFEDRIKFLDVNETRGTKYDAFVFCGLPPNFDEQRVSRAPWAAENFQQIAKRFKGVPCFVVSSIWGAVQNDGVVPEEIECERRKPLSQFEAVAQQYENKLLRSLEKEDNQWFLVRLPMMSGATTDGRLLDITGPLTLFEKLSAEGHKERSMILSYNPDATMWLLPVDAAVNLFWRLLEDDQRPRITNLVSTQSTLNQEWLQHLAKALGYKKASSADSDSFHLPGFLRKELNDNVLVKTRGLFEVVGRYQQVPTVLDDEYFQRVIDFCRSENWGKIPPAEQQPAERIEAQFDEALARTYFTQFLPSKVTSDSVKEITADENGIGFKVENEEGLDWILRPENGHAVVQRAQDLEITPKVRFCFTGKGMQKLIERKVSLERALVMREARVEGNPIEVLRACNFLRKFLKENPYSTEKPELQDAGKH